MAILQNQSPFVNGGNSVGNLYANGGSMKDTTGAVANGGNTSYGGSVNSAAAMKGAGMYSVTGTGGNPSSTQRPFPQSGGGKRRRSKTSRKSRKNRHSHSRSRKHGRKYGGRKRVTRYRSRSRRGGYAQYMTGVASTFGQTMPGYPLTSRMSALANPPPFRPYQNCPGGL